MAIRVLLVVKEGKTREKYLREVKPYGVNVDVVSSVGEICTQLTETPYNGIMVDLETKMKASADEKKLVNELQSLFPLLQLKRDSATGTVRSLYIGQFVGGNGTLEDFLEEECRAFTPRTIRASMRKVINFNVILGPHPDLSRRKVEKSVTLNVSQGGCYLYSVRKWKANETAWFVFKELDDLTPIQADVRWCVQWGTSMKVPGIGVQFRNLQDTHLEQFIKEHHI
jgi:hypothetical protein